MAFNTKMIAVMKDENRIYEERQEILLDKVLKAIYEAESFSEDDLAELELKGFANKDYFDLLSYATNFMAKSKLIEVYTKKEA